MTKYITKRQTQEEHFFSNILKTDTCWIWTGCKDKLGYGRTKVGGRKGKMWLVHRYMWFKTYGSLEPTQKVLHKCDNPSCIYPEHLFLGSQIDNIKDMWNKKRGAQGSRMSNAKLKEADIPIIRRLAKEGMTHHEIASRFGVVRQIIGRVLSKEIWKHVD